MADRFELLPCRVCGQECRGKAARASHERTKHSRRELSAAIQREKEQQLTKDTPPGEPKDKPGNWIVATFVEGEIPKLALPDELQAKYENYIRHKRVADDAYDALKAAFLKWIEDLMIA